MKRTHLHGTQSPLWIAALLAAAVLLTSCSGGAAQEPGTVTFVIESTPANLDPRIGTDVQSERIHSLLFSSLLERDTEMNMSGDLAERWEPRADIGRREVHLRLDPQRRHHHAQAGRIPHGGDGGDAR
jgi:ABC-type transport system substrate-binding protein